ncbi:MAG TPA: hypothetical protein DD405_05595 [Desulfobacteraceae bacterium]|nr:hypothetical protein [Desulfobacteraceae bacterium]
MPIVFENFSPPLDQKYFYFLGWVTALLFFHPKTFIFKRILYLYLFAIWYFILIYFGLYNVELNWIRHEIEALFFAIIMLQYFLSSKDIKWLQILLAISFCFIIITIITTLIGLQSHPLASRQLAGGLAVKGEYALISYYRSIGIAGYDFFYGLAFTVPVLVAFLKMKKINNNLKVVLFFVIVLAMYGILKAQFTTAFLFAVIGAGIAFWTDEKVKPAFFRLIAVLIVVIFFPKDFVTGTINSFAGILDEGLIQNRLIDLSITLSQGIGEGRTHIDYRYDRIPILMDSFFHRPVLGGGVSLGHNWWLDRLSLFGLTGVVPWILLLWFQIKYNLTLFHENNRIYYLITMILYVVMGFIKNMGQQQTMIFLFFIIPGLLIIKDTLTVKIQKG